MTFSDLGLSQKVLDAIDRLGYSEPTPIQAGAIPKVLQKRDVLGIAQTGTGKTASFTLPMLTMLERGRARARMPRTLIVEPTRELAAQVADSFARYGSNHKLTVALLIGGISFAEQDQKLMHGADVLIATPGRLLDHFERGKLLLNGVEILVIDEADRMLDMGFIPDIERIVKLIPFTRQTLFFSATMPPEISRLADSFLQNPVRLEVAPASTPAENVTQLFVGAQSVPGEKRATLREEIRNAEALTNAIIFCNRKRDVGIVAGSLKRHKFSSGALHGDMDQHNRMAMLEQFRGDELQILVASDVAARGLDIPAVSHVFNYDIPATSDEYVHRIGRTGRAGRSGTAISIVTPADERRLQNIEKMLGRALEWRGEPTDFSAPETPRGRTTVSRGQRKAAHSQADRHDDAALAPGKTAHGRARSADENTASDTRRRAAGQRERVSADSQSTGPAIIGFGKNVPAFFAREMQRP